MTDDILNEIENIDINGGSNIDYDIRKCITYIDEFEFGLIKGEIQTRHIVSFTAMKKDYIDAIEKEWVKIRKKYGFKFSEPIHFANIREISKVEQYEDENGNIKECIGWNCDYIKYKYINEIKNANKNKVIRKFKENYDIWKKFNRLENDKYVLDFDKLKSFYSDIIECIKNANLTILCTSHIEYLKNNLYRKGKHKNIDKQFIKSPYYMSFLEHLNLLSFYLMHGYLDNNDEKYKNPIYKQHFSTKIRCDGDDGFNSKEEYRRAFNEAITVGTREFIGKSLINTIDEIRFINKCEIGNVLTENSITHSGCDIIDFIASYVGMYSIKNEFIQIEMQKGSNEEEANRKFEERITFTVGDRKFNPIEECIEDKILNYNGYIGLQKIKESNFMG